GVNFIAMAEIMALGLAVGLDRTKLANEIERSEAASFVSANHYPKYVLTQRYDSRFTLGLMRKDVSIASLIAAETGLPRPYLHRVVDFYDEVTPSQPDADNTRLFPEIEAWLGRRSRDDIAVPETFLADLLTGLAATTLLGTREFVIAAESS
ncbi:MAG: NAD-binding protein, partial [Candidatus Methylopumilus sp.]